MNTRARVSRTAEHQPQVAKEDPYHLKYRPKRLDDVIGQPAAVKALMAMMVRPNMPHVFLLTGPSGVGKTTIARVIAGLVGCDPHNVTEVDAATHSGIDAMRALTESATYQGFGNKPSKMIILNEAHKLSKDAWQALLMPTEEPPAHVFYALTTTDPSKVPDTIKTRCAAFDLKPVGRTPIFNLLCRVCESEKLDTPDAFLGLIADACGGSVRQALLMLATVQDCQTEDEVVTLLEAPYENAEVIDLCRQVVKGDLRWDALMKTLNGLEDMSAESIRIVLVNYLNACIKGARSDRDVVRLLEVLDCFSKPFTVTDKMAPLYLAFGDLIFRK